MDCDYYKRCYMKFGKPKILNDVNVIIRLGDHQLTETKVNQDLINKENMYVSQKYAKI